MSTDVFEWIETLPAGIVAGEGLWGSAWMIVGDAPGLDEAYHMRPFVGEAGRELRGMLARVAVDEDRIWMTNVYKALPERAQLSPEEIQEHLPYLIHEIHESQPKYILALGDVAFHALTDIAMSISLYRGFWQPLAEALRREHPMPDPSLSPKDQIPLIQPIVLPTYHPAHILRNRKQLPIWQRDIAEWYAKESAA